MPRKARLVDVGSIGSYFESLGDPHYIRNRKHSLVDIAIIAGGDCVIAVENNQPTLLVAIESLVFGYLEGDIGDLSYRYHETLDDGHGQITNGRIISGSCVAKSRRRGNGPG